MVLRAKSVGTISIALAAWKARCESEAKTMLKWAGEYAEKGEHELAAKCRCNADASHSFIREADDALADLNLR